jgi:hypothetical protein
LALQKNSPKNQCTACSDRLARVHRGSRVPQESKVKAKVGETLAKEVKAVGVAVIGDDGSGLEFKCRSCRKTWGIKWDESDEVMRGWWRCPGGCNANVVRSSDRDLRWLWRKGRGSEE